MVMVDKNSTPRKYSSVYPLPGGVEQYFETLVSILRQVRDHDVTIPELRTWLESEFSTTFSDVSFNGYVGMVSRLGVLDQNGEFLGLTPDGTAIVTEEEVNADKSRKLVMEIKVRDFVGYLELLAILSDGPKSLDEIHERLCKKLKSDWETNAPTSFRMNWLRSLRYAVKDGKTYAISSLGREFLSNVNGNAVTPRGCDVDDSNVSGTDKSTSLTLEATRISNRLDEMAVTGGDGKEFERATQSAFHFLGFDTQLISGPGNPDVLATATMGRRTYRLLIDSKSRASGVVQQNDVNFPVLDKQRLKASADHVIVVGASFAGGNLEEFATKQGVRLLTTTEIRSLLLVHAESAIPLDDIRPLFRGGGQTNEAALTELLAAAAAKNDLMRLARDVFSAVRKHQDREGTINVDSLYYILKAEHSLPMIRLTVEFLKADHISALGETDTFSLYTRITPQTLTNKLRQISHALDVSGIE